MQPIETCLRLGILSAQVAALVLLVALAQHALRGWLAPRWRCWLWGLVALRLCLPVSVGTHWSVFNLMPRWNPADVPVAAPVDSKRSVSTATSFSREPAAPEPRVRMSAGPIVVEPRAVAASEPTPAVVASTPMESIGPPLAQHAADAPAWPRWLLAAWLAGIVLFAARTAWTCRLISRWVRSGRPVTDRAILDAVAEAARTLGVRTSVGILEVDGVGSPALHGFLRPRLLFPPGLGTRLLPAQLRHVLLHEFAHVRRRDIALNWLLAVLQAVHWFNPFVWFAFARLRAERELACDELVLRSAVETDPESYGRTLLAMLANAPRNASAPGTVGILEGRADLKRRLLHIAEFRPGRRTGALAVVLVAIAGAVTLTDAQTPKVTAVESAKVAESPRANLPATDMATSNALVRIGGTVLGERGRPIAGATVLVHRFYTNEQPKDDPAEISDFRLATATTGKDGRWEVDGVPSGLFPTIGVSASHPDWAPALVPSIGEFNGTRQKLLRSQHVFVLAPLTTLSGVVVDEGGRPVAGADIRVMPAGRSSFHTTTTDPSGRFQVARLHAMPTTVDAGAEGFRYALKEVSIEPTTPELRFVLARGRTVRGRVVDATGKPLARVIVSLFPKGPRDYTSIGGNFSTVTQADGRFEWTGAPDSDLNYEARNETLSATSGVVPDGPGHEVIITMNECRRLHLSVVDSESGAPVKYFAVSVFDGERETVFQHHQPRDGEFAEKLRSDSMHRMMIVAPGYRPQDAEIPAASGGRVDATIRLAPIKALEGMVVDGAGNPVPHATVGLVDNRIEGCIRVRPGRLEPTGAGQVVETDSLGRFRFDKTGFETSIAAAHPIGFATLSLGDFARTGTIVLADYGTVEIDHHRYSDSAVPDHFRVSFGMGTSSGLAPANDAYVLAVKSSGRFLVEQFPTGIPGGNRLENGFSITDFGFEVRPRQTTKLSVGASEARLTGRFVLPVGFARESGRILVRLRSGFSIGEMSDDERRTYLASKEFRRATSEATCRVFLAQDDGTFSIDCVEAGIGMIEAILIPNELPGPGGRAGTPRAYAKQHTWTDPGGLVEVGDIPMEAWFAQKAASKQP